MQLFIPGPVGRLEAILWMPKGEQDEELAPRAVAVVCHPHPLAGGTMHNNVVFRTARGLQRAGFAVLRFDFRGVEGSEGSHDGRGGEDEDARAAVAWLAARFPGLAIWGAGFSFGARTMMALAPKEPRLARILLVALPVKSFDCSALTLVPQPTHLVMSGNDEHGSYADLRARFPVLPAHIDAEVIEGVDHFFRGKTPELEARVRRFAEQTLELPR
ncbi:MAG: alpha/beta hydrolase [Planctomycetes bacterium]|nr:alpha/beta hydrolase [Planctomycetota bacterium]